MIGHLIEVKSLSRSSVPIVPPPDPPDLSTGRLRGVRKLRREVSGQRGTERRTERHGEEEEMRGDMEWL